jgi:hypothetical protein
MSIFKKAVKEAEKLDTIPEPINETTPPEKEWIWVEGYKGTDRNMCCRDYQYEMGKQFDMPEDTEIEECECGFHLCLTLKDTFKYYRVRDGHRFFKVKALVRKTDRQKYGTKNYDLWGYYIGEHDKLVAKSIIFTLELTIDEILESIGGTDLPEQYKPLVIEHSLSHAYDKYHTDTLVEDGYSQAFASHLAQSNKFDVAHAIGSQKDLSMDMKVLYILNKT